MGELKTNQLKTNQQMAHALLKATEWLAVTDPLPRKTEEAPPPMVVDPKVVDPKAAARRLVQHSPAKHLRWVMSV
jgi:hypothetical protein